MLNVIPVNVGGPASGTPEKDLGKKPTAKSRRAANDEYTAKDSFGNLRAEGYWALRERFRTNTIRLPAGTPQAERLAGELAALKYKTVAGRIYIESKDDMKRRGKQSPDLADAAMLAFLVPTAPRKKHSAVWGSARKNR